MEVADYPGFNNIFYNLAVWNNWGSWRCSVTCGFGTRTRTRTCNTINSIPCEGTNIESDTCNPRSCPGKPS